MNKRCPKCGETKSTTDFYREKTTKDGLSSWCKICKAAYRLTPAWRESNRASVNKYQATLKGKAKLRCAIDKHKEAHPEQVKAMRAAYHALTRGDIDWFPCEVCFAMNSQMHHADYKRKTDVIWTCSKHHGILDQVRRIIEEHLTVGVGDFDAVAYTRGWIARNWKRITAEAA